jgi:hypothetical protein
MQIADPLAIVAELRRAIVGADVDVPPAIVNQLERSSFDNRQHSSIGQSAICNSWRSVE